MAKFRISSNDPVNVPIPPVGQITIFADSTDNSIPKYKTSDGIVHTFGAGIGTTEHPDTVLTIASDPSLLTPNVVAQTSSSALGLTSDCCAKGDGQYGITGFGWQYVIGWVSDNEDWDTKC